METIIPTDDPVRLLSAFLEGMDLSELYATYDRIRKNQAISRQMLKIMIYASMNRLFSSRDIETACKRNVNLCIFLKESFYDCEVHFTSSVFLPKENPY